MVGFERKRDSRDFIDMGATITQLSYDLTDDQVRRVTKVKNYWNFYEGYHWEDMPDVDTPEVTVNYCSAFVNKFVAFELGNGFTFTMHESVENEVVTADGRTLFEYLEDVWEDNNQFILSTELGQMKSVTGDAWLQVKYFSPEELDDPLNKYPDGRLRILLQPTSVIFPEYDPHEKGRLTRLQIIYPYYEEATNILGRKKTVMRTFKQIWTKDEVATYLNGKDPVVVPNRYGTIPFVQIKNFILAGRNDGVSDLENIIPMNMEYDIKKSNTSEILDYHAAPVTLVYGAKIGHLEKGANKLWGGLPKDARVENLQLNGDLGASSKYLESLKTEMCEIGGIPEAVLGGTQAISNTSGVALQYMNLPLLERTKVKRASTEDGLERLNELILLVSLLEGIITKPESIPMRDFVHNEVSLPDTLPKDTLLELQAIEIEMKLGLEDRTGALKRLGRENIEQTLARIDKDRDKHPELYGIKSQEDVPQMNSGMTNSQTQQEVVNIEKNGQTVENPDEPT